MTDDARHNRGLALLDQLFGLQPPPPEPGSIEEVTVDYLFGELWTRSGLSLRDRTFVTITTLAALGREPYLKFHLRGALQAGVTEAEILEMILHVGHYAGWPLAMAATAVARSVFAEARAGSTPAASVNTVLD
jgi:4-carboxymuconolactone decarboxylase